MICFSGSGDDTGANHKSEGVMDREELKARTKQFALRVMRMTDVLPRSNKGRVLADQILRSATSVASGYRAACRARSRADWIDKIGRTLEEADETLLWLELIEESGLLPSAKLLALKKEADELTAIFTSIHKSSKS
ncbi:MAG: four helix bundle protein [Verrucomicrobia bacterium]|nr:four helix bundle protein [Verrucomicrobiota bacterium]